MVSTRQMSTSLSGNNSGASNNSVEAESMQRFSVITRQAASCSNVMITTSTGGGVATISRASNNGLTNPNFQQQPQMQSQSSASTLMTPAGRVSNVSTTSQNIFLLDMPMEILDKIFSYVTYKKVGQLRVVSHKMNDICMAVLNSTFSKLINQMVNRFQNIKAKMPRRESARRNHPLACECDIIETCYMRLSLLQMTFGKHIERKHCCFFPGGILDEVYNVLSYIRNTSRLEKPYRVTDELFDLSTMAMEYFKDHIEPNLPDIAYFNKDFFNLPSTKRPSSSSLKVSSELSDSSSNSPSPPQSNMVLRKGIRKIKQGMKMYNNQLSMLRSELRNCKRKSSEQGKQIAEQQKLLAEQQKQALEYANRLDENDKKNEEMSRKFSTLLQELNKCKTELQYWRSKSPATPMCTSCGQKMTPIVPPEDYQALVNQGVKPEDININLDDTDESDTSSNTISLSTEFAFPDESTTAKLIAVNTASKNLKRHHNNSSSSNSSSSSSISSSSSSSSISSINNTSSSSSFNGNQLQCIGNNGTFANSDLLMANIDNANGKRSTVLASTSIATSSNINDLNLDMLRNGTNAKDSNSGWFAIGGGGVVCNSNIVATGCPASLFYGSTDKAGTSSANMSTTAGSPIVYDLNVAGPDDGAGNHQPPVIAADVTSLSLLASNETKKARRVQKGSRCHNISSKRK
ncbi:uncharacterized protein DDB_G0271670 [Eupeodes corollae]|uniref:uncharacterized protein DDB_G0271670 n=1 Tax=Eupeodes corollae TaxID=290404 RepID=UPI0024930731|nr:uncharacterized protein DDB_G0271670 [Eupeodes corollae]